MNDPRSMPVAISIVYGPLRQQFLTIRAKVDLFRQLFTTSEERIDLLNRFAATFIGFAQIIFYDDIVGSLFRLIDPAESHRIIGKRPNLSLERLASVVRDDRRGLGEWLESERVRIETIIVPYEGWRNKRTSHNDFSTIHASFTGASQLQGPSIQEIMTFLGGVGGMLNAVQRDYLAEETFYGKEGTPITDAGDRLIATFQVLAEYIDRERQLRLPPTKTQDSSSGQG